MSDERSVMSMNFQPTTIEDVVSNGLCAGCGACAGVVPDNVVRMELSSAGYLRPKAWVPLDVAQQRSALVACPSVRLEHSNLEAENLKIWGPTRSVATAFSTDAEIRQFGSSGGVVSALALYLVESGAVDFVAQIAVSKEHPLTNKVQQSRTRQDILHAAGSRYAPAAPLERISEFLQSGERFAFVGKPCDVAALRALAKVDERVNRQVPYMISFMCAGVPSIEGTHAVLKEMGVRCDEVASFRYRGDGWPGVAKATTLDGRVAEMDYNSSWGSVLNRYLQYRCKICPDGTGEFADVVCADAWYGVDGYPDFSEGDGRSLLLVRTAAGEELVAMARKGRRISTESIPVEEIAKMQPYQVNRKQMVLGRLAATLIRRGTAPRFWNLGLIRASLSAKPLAWLRSTWGAYKRADGELN